MTAPLPNLKIANPLDLSAGALSQQQVQQGVVAIGNFDGVHLGHQVVLDHAKAIAAEKGLAVFAMTFEPHPRTVFSPDTPIFRLTPASEKALVLSACGMSGVLQTPFTKTFSSLTAEDFIQEVLIKQLQVAHVVVGFDFHFGAKRVGSPDYLKDAGRRLGFDVTIVDGHGDEAGSLYSSSDIRHHLASGQIDKANAALGYRWFVTGEIRHGEKRGRELNYPTANMALSEDCGLKHGIYAVRMVVDGEVHKGVASFGRRPTFDNGAPLLETYVFDFSGDLYGKTVSVVFEAFQRPELRFDGIEALIAQMDKDSEEARTRLQHPRLTKLDERLADLLTRSFVS